MPSGARGEAGEDWSLSSLGAKLVCGVHTLAINSFLISCITDDD